MAAQSVYFACGLKATEFVLFKCRNGGISRIPDTGTRERLLKPSLSGEIDLHESGNEVHKHVTSYKQTPKRKYQAQSMNEFRIMRISK
jgi:hypothetical protein